MSRGGGSKTRAENDHCLKKSICDSVFPFGGPKNTFKAQNMSWRGKLYSWMEQTRLESHGSRISSVSTQTASLQLCFNSTCRAFDLKFSNGCLQGGLLRCEASFMRWLFLSSCPLSLSHTSHKPRSVTKRQDVESANARQKWKNENSEKRSSRVESKKKKCSENMN